MTTFIIKNADFSGGRLVDYDSPVADAEVCAWLGGSLPDAARNFGTQGELSIRGGPVVMDDLWCRVSGAGFFETSTHLARDTTFIVVTKSVGDLTTGANRPAIISNEAGDATVKAGYTMWMGAPTAPETRYIWSNLVYTDATNKQWIGNSGLKLGNVKEPMFLIGETTRNPSDWLRTTIENFTTPVESNGVTAGGYAGPFSFPGNIRIGAMHRTDAGAMIGPVDIAFVMIVPRLLSATEKQRVYNSVKRRFASFGIAI
ncbi:hypothetical protein D9M71_115740 [compost metagenome]